jgi:hypothetical protein
LSLLQSLSAKNRGVSVNQRQVFWQFYLPMLRALLWERSKARYSDFPPSIFTRLIQIATELWESSSDDPPSRASQRAKLKPETRTP